jgi:hypothetical protein
MYGERVHVCAEVSLVMLYMGRSQELRSPRQWWTQRE